MGDRVALVIGNSKYPEGQELPNAFNDANDVAEQLQILGFKVIVRHDLKQNPMENALNAFIKEISKAETALLYYAGHGIESESINYLLPIDVEFEIPENDFELERRQLARRAFALRDVVEDMEKKARKCLLFLDTCRNNPLRPLFRPRNQIGDRHRKFSIHRGAYRDSLGPMTVEPSSSSAFGEGTLLVFATASGQQAFDGLNGSRNSPFTASFLEHVQTPGLPIAGLVEAMRSSIVRATDGRQHLWEHRSPFEFCFKPVITPNASREVLFWNEFVKDSAILEDYVDFLRRFSDGVFALEANRRGNNILAASRDILLLGRLIGDKTNPFQETAFHRLAVVEWDAISTAGSPRAVIEDFISRYSGTAPATSAERELFELQRDEDWETANGSMQTILLRKFIETYRFDAINRDAISLTLVQEAEMQLGHAVVVDRFLLAKASPDLANIRSLQIELKDHFLAPEIALEICTRSEVRWKAIVANTNKLTFEKFAKDFPDTAETKLATRRIFQLGREDAWLRLNENKNIEDLDKFIATFGEGSDDRDGHALMVMARRQLKELTIERTWLKLKASGDTNAIRSLIEELGTHQIVPTVRAEFARLARLAWSSLEGSLDKLQLNAFAIRFSPDPLSDIARKRILEIDLEEAWKAAEGTSDEEVLRGIVNRYGEDQSTRGQELLVSVSKRLTDLKLDQRWLRLKEQAGLVPLRAFREELADQHPQLAADVDIELGRLADIAWVAVDDGADRVGLSKFIEWFSSDARVAEARRQIVIIERRETSMALWESSDTHAIAAFIAKYGEADDLEGIEQLKDARGFLNWFKERDRWVEYALGNDQLTIQEAVAQIGTNELFCSDVMSEIERLAESEWSSVIGCKDVEKVENFHGRFYGLPQAEDAYRLLYRLICEENWSRIDGKSNEEDVLSFIDTCADGPDDAFKYELIAKANRQLLVIRYSKRLEGVRLTNSLSLAEGLVTEMTALTFIDSDEKLCEIVQATALFIAERSEWVEDRAVDFELIEDSRDEIELQNFVRTYAANSNDQVSKKMIASVRLILGQIVQEREWRRGT